MKVETKRKIVSIISLSLFVIVLTLGAIFIGEPIVKIVSDPQEFREWTQAQPASEFIFILMNVIQIVIAVIPGELFEVAAGCAFGIFWGMVLSLIGVLIGSAITFALSKRFGVKIVDAFYPIEKINELRFLRSEKGLRTTYLILMLIPGTPKDLLTYVFGLTKLGWMDYLWISVIGRFPNIFLSVLSGHHYVEGNYITAVVIYAVTFVAALIGAYFYKKYLNSKAKQASADEIEENADSSTQGSEEK